jgi:hypothetical protein
MHACRAMHYLNDSDYIARFFVKRQSYVGLSPFKPFVTFLLSESQPKNALVNPTPQIWKQMQTFKRECSILQFYIAGVQF